MPKFSCHLALTFGLKNLRMSGRSDITAPATGFGLLLLRQSRMQDACKQKSRFNLGRMTSLSIVQYEDGIDRCVLFLFVFYLFSPLFMFLLMLGSIGIADVGTYGGMQIYCRCSAYWSARSEIHPSCFFLGGCLQIFE